jgi:hypothetical protein
LANLLYKKEALLLEEKALKLSIEGDDPAMAKDYRMLLIKLKEENLHESCSFFCNLIKLV